MAAWGRAGLAPPEVSDDDGDGGGGDGDGDGGDGDDGVGDTDDDDQVVTTLLGEWSQLLGSGRRLEEVCMWTTAVVDRSLSLMIQVMITLSASAVQTYTEQACGSKHLGDRREAGRSHLCQGLDRVLFLRESLLQKPPQKHKIKRTQ